MKKYYLLLFFSVLMYNSSYTQTCQSEVIIEKAVECNLPKLIATNQFLLPCNDPFGITNYPVGTKLLIDFQAGSCFSICLQGEPVDILCASFITSIEEKYTDSSKNIFPQPVKDMLTINAINPKSIQIFNLNGSLVYKQEGSKLQHIDVSGLQAGIYFIKILTKENTGLAKFIKM